MTDILNFIDPQDVNFYISEGKLLCLVFKGQDIGRVSVKRMFPFDFPDEYIVVCNENYQRTDTENEIGILRNINKHPKEQIKLIREELNKRYFIPVISKVEYAKEDYGNISFKVETDAGKREFVVTDMSSNIKRIDESKIMLTDVFGNRYCIPDVKKIDEKTLKILEIWI